jgi:hypothetical protein
MEDSMEGKDLTRSCGSAPRDRRTQRNTKEEMVKKTGDTPRDRNNVNRINVLGFDKRVPNWTFGFNNPVYPIYLRFDSRLSKRRLTLFSVKPRFW